MSKRVQIYYRKNGKYHKFTDLRVNEDITPEEVFRKCQNLNAVNNVENFVGKCGRSMRENDILIIDDEAYMVTDPSPVLFKIILDDYIKEVAA